jgi:hypothetical protein
MKNTTRSAIAAAAIAAAGLAVTTGVAGAATAAPRIADHAQLRASIVAAASAQSLSVPVLPGQPTGLIDPNPPISAE